MKTFEVHRQLQRLESLMTKVARECADDPELLGHWARYLCILCAGFLEGAISEIYSDYVKRSASPAVANFATVKLNRIQNPKAEKFVETARSFFVQWAEDLERYMEENGRKDAINSIMSIRHLVAHGKNAGISMANVRDYLNRSVEVLEFIEGQLVL